MKFMLKRYFNPRRLSRPLFRVFWPITAIYTLWGILSAVAFRAGLLLTPDNGATEMIILLSVIFFVGMASVITAIFLIYIEPHLQDQPNIRKLFLILTAMASAGLFFLVRQTGNPRPVIYILNTANLLVFANLLGSWIVTPLRRAAELIPLCLVMALADLFSVAGGPTRELAKNIDQYYKTGMKGPPPLVDFILIKVVAPGQANLMPVFGLADWVIVAFLSAYAMKFGINDNLTGKSMDEMVQTRQISFYFPVAVLGLLTACFLAWRLKLFLPALPVIALFFLAYVMVRCPQARQLTRSDWKLMLGATGIMAILMLVYYVVKR